MNMKYDRTSMNIDEDIASSSPEQPLVSIGLPTYNRPKWLYLTLESITEQDYQNLEVIVSDDDFPGEETENVVKKIMEQDSRIRYYRQKDNLGEVANHKFVLEKAAGEYFFWASDDDIYRPTFISRCVQALEDSPKSILAFTSIAWIDEKGQITHTDSDFMGTTGLDLLGHVHVSFLHQNPAYFHALIRRYALQKIDWARQGFWGDDTIVLINLALQGHFRKVPEALYLRRINPLDIRDMMERVVPLDRRPRIYLPASIHMLESIRAIWSSDLSPLVKLVLSFDAIYCLERRRITNVRGELSNLLKAGIRRMFPPFSITGPR